MEGMEDWKDIGESNYQVSALGNVRNKKSGLILKPKPVPKKRGYVCYDVTIADTIGGKQNHHKIHRLVATAFLPNPENKPEIDHIDRNPANNKVENLRWATRSENAQNTGLRSDNTSGEKQIYKPSGRDKFVLRINEKHIGCYDTLEEAVADRERFEKGEIVAPVQQGVLNEKNIHLTDGSYRVQIRKKGLECCKRFKTLEEAIAYRNTFISNE
jgi:hypothetical protein